MSQEKIPPNTEALRWRTCSIMAVYAQFVIIVGCRRGLDLYHRRLRHSLGLLALFLAINPTVNCQAHGRYRCISPAMASCLHPGGNTHDICPVKVPGVSWKHFTAVCGTKSATRFFLFGEFRVNHLPDFFSCQMPPRHGAFDSRCESAADSLPRIFIRSQRWVSVIFVTFLPRTPVALASGP